MELVSLLRALYNLKTKEETRRICKKGSETIHHIAAGCEELAKIEHIKRHNSIAKYVHDILAKENGFKVSQKWWEWTSVENGVKEYNQHAIESTPENG